MGKMVDLSKYRRYNSNDLVLHEIGEMRAIVDIRAQTVWYLSENGQILINRMDEGELTYFRTSGALSINPNKSDVWYEAGAWETLPETGAWQCDDAPSDAYAIYWDKWAIYMLIGQFLNKLHETDKIGRNIQKVYKQYTRGLMTTWECMDEIATISGF